MCMCSNCKEQQYILCKFLINSNLISNKSKHSHTLRIRLHNLNVWQSLKNIWEHITSVQTLGEEQKNVTNFTSHVSLEVFILRLSILRTVCISITLPVSWKKTAVPSPTDLLESGWTTHSNPAAGKLCALFCCLNLSHL